MLIYGLLFQAMGNGRIDNNNDNDNEVNGTYQMVYTWHQQYSDSYKRHSYRVETAWKASKPLQLKLFNQ